MSDHVTITVDETTRNRLEKLKDDGETYKEVLMQAVEVLEQDSREGEQTPPNCVECGDTTTTWTIIDGRTFCENCADIDFGV